MIEADTVRLLRECDAGVKMGVSALDEVLENTQGRDLRKMLTQAKDDHEKLGGEIQLQLARCQDEGKEPNPMAKGMSWLKTNVMMGLDLSDHTVADLITDGCNMGVKSLSRYLNEYAAADEQSKDVAKKLIRLEDRMATDLREYL